MFFRLVSVLSYCLHTFLLSVYRKHFTFLSFFLIFLYFYKLLARPCTVIYNEAGSTQTSNKRELQKVADSFSRRVSSISSLEKNVNVSNLFISCIIDSHVRCIVSLHRNLYFVHRLPAIYAIAFMIFLFCLDL